MGRQSDDSDKLLILTTENGYKKEEYREKDANSIFYNYINKTVYNYDCALRRYVI
jgi:hypothetical protein